MLHIRFTHWTICSYSYLLIITAPFYFCNLGYFRCLIGKNQYLSSCDSLSSVSIISSRCIRVVTNRREFFYENFLYFSLGNDFNYFGYSPRKRIGGLCGNHVLNFEGNFHSAFCSCGINLHFLPTGVQGSNIYTWYLFFCNSYPKTGLRFIWFAFSWLRLNICVYLLDFVCSSWWNVCSSSLLLFNWVMLRGVALSYCYILEVYIAYKYSIP